jgi:hypothetical protein
LENVIFIDFLALKVSHFANFERFTMSMKILGREHLLAPA